MWRVVDIGSGTREPVDNLYTLGTTKDQDEFADLRYAVLCWMTVGRSDYPETIVGIIESGPLVAGLKHASSPECKSLFRTLETTN
eukprot:scaffold36682_cov36-Prasinocladus_malaysianus.AAC.2